MLSEETKALITPMLQVLGALVEGEIGGTAGKIARQTIVEHGLTALETAGFSESVEAVTTRMSGHATFGD